MRRAAFLSLAFAAFCALPATAQTIAITGGRVVTNGPQGVIDNGTVVISNGRISAVTSGAPPAGATIVDAAGKWVTPGLFAAYSQAGLAEMSSEAPTNDISASGDMQASLRIADGFNPDATAIAVTRIDGVTRLALAGGAGSGLIGPYGALANTSGALTGSIDRREAFMIAWLGESGSSRAGGSRAAAWQWLMAAIEDAKAYPRRYADDKDAGDVLSRRDAAAFAPVVSGGVPLIVQARRASDILQVIDLKRREPRMQLIILGAEEGWRVAPQLAAAGIPVIVNPHQNLPASLEMVAATMENAARLHAAGVKVAIANPGDAAQNTRLIQQLAGNAAGSGMPWDAAFAAITRTPAELFGRTDLGVLTAGAIADVVIWDGDPLEVMSSPDAVYIAGAPTVMESRQTKLRDRYLDLDPAGPPAAYRR